MSAPRSRSWLHILLVGALLATWIGWLRAPTIRVTMWNVDESIHAAVARTLLEGGVMYRDTVDQRSPLTYYAFAAVFRVAGMNNLTAVRVVIAAIIVVTAVLLFLIGRRFRNAVMGWFAALIYAATTSYLLFPGDLYAAHTEWFVALFTTCGATLFLTSSDCPSIKRSLAIGLCFALSFLSKQPALTDLGAPLGTLLYLGIFRSCPWRRVSQSLLSIIAGFVLPVGLVLLALVLAGAGPSMLFYAWTYNLTYYGPAVDWSTRLLSAGPFFAQLIRIYPLVFIFATMSAIAIAIRVVQFRPSPAVLANRGRECFLLLWCATSLVGAMSGGRGYDHYFFQCLPPLALLAAWAPGVIAASWSSRRSSVAMTTAVFLGVITASVAALELFWIPPTARKVPPPPLDPALPIAAFIREHSLPTDKIFAWGYNPDIYLYADRSPASRFVYCSFQTGLIPWTNEDPSIDTTYAIVPGSMDTLLADLRKNSPVFIIDCGVGPHRRFTKYPLRNFPPLRHFVEENYVEINPGHFLPYGFRVLMLRDKSTESLPPGPVIAQTKSDERRPVVIAQPHVGAGTSLITVDTKSTKADLQRLALYVDDQQVSAVRFPLARDMNIQVPVTFDAAGPASHRLEAVLTLADGTRLSSEPFSITVVPLDTSIEKQSVFALPLVAGSVKADGVRALFNPRVDSGDGTRTFALHAPSLLTYSLEPNVRRIRGRYGIPAGAYAPENKGPTDGAEFIIRTVAIDGTTHVLLDRVLNPARKESDRPAQSFDLPLDKSSTRVRLEFEITPGPSGNAASDWTFWSDITLETLP